LFHADVRKKRLLLLETRVEKIFPTILMILDFFAAVPYAVKGDVKMFVYWVAAGVLTLSVTWL
jgi:hypothetical protein